MKQRIHRICFSTLILEGTMKDGKLHGTFKNCGNNGKLQSTMNYDNNSLIEN